MSLLFQTCLTHFFLQCVYYRMILLISVMLFLSLRDFSSNSLKVLDIFEMSVLCSLEIYRSFLWHSFVFYEDRYVFCFFASKSTAFITGLCTNYFQYFMWIYKRFYFVRDYDTSTSCTFALVVFMFAFREIGLNFGEIRIIIFTIFLFFIRIPSCFFLSLHKQFRIFEVGGNFLEYST